MMSKPFQITEKNEKDIEFMIEGLAYLPIKAQPQDQPLIALLKNALRVYRDIDFDTNRLFKLKHQEEEIQTDINQHHLVKDSLESAITQLGSDLQIDYLIKRVKDEHKKRNPEEYADKSEDVAVECSN